MSTSDRDVRKKRLSEFVADGLYLDRGGNGYPGDGWERLYFGNGNPTPFMVNGQDVAIDGTLSASRVEGVTAESIGALARDGDASQALVKGRTLDARAVDVVNVLDFDGVDPTGASDSSSGFALAFARAQTLSANRSVAVYIPGGRYRLDSQVVFTVPGTPSAGTYNGVRVYGDGGHTTKLVAGANNAAGLLKIVVPYEKHSIVVEDIQFVSNIDASVSVDHSNGRGLWITSSNTTDSNPLPGLYNGYSVQVRRCVWMADTTNEGDAQLRWGVWSRALQIDYQWLPVVEDCVIHVPTNTALAAYGSPANNEAGIYFRHCYAPRMRHINVHGFFQTGVRCQGVITSPAQAGRWEGGLIAESEIGSCLDGFVIDNPYATEPSIFPPEFRVSGMHASNKRHTIRVNYHSLVTVTGCNLFAPGAPSGSEVLPAAIFLENASNVLIAGNQFDGEGFYTDADAAAVAVRIDGTSSDIAVKANTFNAGGVSIRANNTQSTNALVSPRSIHVSGNSWIGRKSGGWAANIKIVDKNATVLFQDTVQAPNADKHRIEGHTKNLFNTPVLQIARLRDDYATSNSVPLGAAQFTGYNSDGVEKEFGIIRAQSDDNISGTEDGTVTHSVMVAGVQTDVLRCRGASVDVGRITGGNYAQVISSGSTVTVRPAGADATIQVNHDTKGSGWHQFYCGGTISFYVAQSANSVNAVKATGSSIGSPALLSPDGADANIRLAIRGKGAGGVQVAGSEPFAFGGATPIAKQSVTGSRGGNAALADLLAKLANIGLITDSTTA